MRAAASNTASGVGPDAGAPARSGRVGAAPGGSRESLSLQNRTPGRVQAPSHPTRGCSPAPRRHPLFAGPRRTRPAVLADAVTRRHSITERVARRLKSSCRMTKLDRIRTVKWAVVAVLAVWLLYLLVS